MKKYFKYLLPAYITAAFFEFIANTIGDGKLFLNPTWPIFFLIWYGFMYTVLYIFFRNKEVWKGVVFFAIFGVIVEIIIFQRNNLIVDPIIYALMGFFPLKAYKKMS